MTMAHIYYRLVVAGERTLESVPDRWRTEVTALLDVAEIEG